jgi:transposase
LVEVHQRYEWTYLYAFVRPKSGEVHWLILPTVNAEVFSIALEHFAREVGAGTRRRILLVLDQAGWHTGKEVEVPEGIELEFLPSASPELQPSERLWPLSNEGVANRFFEEIAELEEALGERCVALCDQPELIRSHTRYQTGGPRQHENQSYSNGLGIIPPCTSLPTTYTLPYEAEGAACASTYPPKTKMPPL